MKGTVLDDIQYSIEHFYDDYPAAKKATIGRNQWQSLRNIEAEYADKELTECNPVVRFDTKVWTLGGNDRINWERYEKKYSEQYPLVLLLKLAAFYYIQIVKLNKDGFTRYIPQFMTVFGEGMKREGILSSDVNQPFVPASVITKEKVEKWIFAAIENSDISSGSYNVLKLLEHITLVPKHFLSQTSKILRIDTDLPWSNINKKLAKTKVYLAQIFDDYDKLQVKSYQPFSEKVLAGVMHPAIELIEKHSPLLIKAFDIAAEPSAYQVRNPTLFKASERDKLIKLHKKLEKHFPNLSIPSLKNYNISKKVIEDWYNLAQGAALWILFLTTALRGIDIRQNIFRDCFEPDGDSDLIFYLLSDIKKTKTKDHIIPIPELTTKAISYLNKTNYAPTDIPQLVVRRTNNGVKGQANSWTYPQNTNTNKLLRLWAEFCGQDVLDGLNEDENPDGMAHRCRATMAGWIGTNSPLAVLIVRRLFGHKNGVMPDHYLRGNRHVQKAREEVRTKTRIDFAENITDSIVNGTFAGGAKDSILEGRDHLKKLITQEASRNNESLTEGEIRKRLKDRIKFILLNKLKNGDMLALQTPLAFVCTRNPASANDAPCAINSAKNRRLEQEIDKAFATQLQMSGLPDLDNCKGASCQHSLLYDNPMTKVLLEQFKYYTLYLRGIKHTNIDLDKEAKSFISLYTQPLSEVYPDIVELVQKDVT